MGRIGCPARWRAFTPSACQNGIVTRRTTTVSLDEELMTTGDVHESDPRQAQPLRPGGRGVVGREHFEHADTKAADEHPDDSDRRARFGQQERLQMRYLFRSR